MHACACVRTERGRGASVTCQGASLASCLPANCVSAQLHILGRSPPRGTYRSLTDTLMGGCVRVSDYCVCGHLPGAGYAAYHCACVGRHSIRARLGPMHECLIALHANLAKGCRSKQHIAACTRNIVVLGCGLQVTSYNQVPHK
jgi:hypothetical protein